jgi:hypothetical protein
MRMVACRLRSWRRPTRAASRDRLAPAPRSSRMQVALAFHQAAAVPLHLLASRERRFSPHPRPTPAGRGRWTLLGHGPSPTRSAFVTPTSCPPGTDGFRTDQREYWWRRPNRGPPGTAPAEVYPRGEPRRYKYLSRNDRATCDAQRRRRGCSSQPTAVSSNTSFHARTSRHRGRPGCARSGGVLLVRPRKKASVGAPAKAGERQQVRMMSRSIRVRQVLSRKESIHRGATSCVAPGDRRGEA